MNCYKRPFFVKSMKQYAYMGVFLSVLLVTPCFSWGQGWPWPGSTASTPLSQDALTVGDAKIQVYFSPKGGGQQAIVDAIGQAKESVYVQAYSFTSAPIAKALVDANKRGVKVEAILDKSQRKATYTGATFLRNEGIPVYIDVAHAIAHSKVMILDGVTVITGSFNFTKAAEEKNAENLLVIKDKGLARLYMENWERHQGHSEGY